MLVISLGFKDCNFWRREVTGFVSCSGLDLAQHDSEQVHLAGCQAQLLHLQMPSLNWPDARA